MSKMCNSIGAKRTSHITVMDATLNSSINFEG